ncbi:hypothetical protein CRM22_005851 [Opisthorchis felineus]|uniref:Protein Lines N-terminal domain-containing protein n=1 Tax=Opisthorchis felineus TaxID=147828 RepID=A0A4V3SER0_OPIFE|nr:hypothetical protein CRM22_005851 [Opisthorchis felineus]
MYRNIWADSQVCGVRGSIHGSTNFVFCGTFDRLVEGFVSCERFRCTTSHCSSLEAVGGVPGTDLENRYFPAKWCPNRCPRGYAIRNSPVVEMCPSMLCTMVRKQFGVQRSYGIPYPSTETVQCLARALYSIVLSTRNFEAELVTFEELLVQLLFGDDSHLFQCLNLWLELEDRFHNCISTQQSLLKMIPDAHWAFARLAQTIGYSAHLLVDWIVSPETNCLTYLVRYLRRFRDPDRCRSIASTEQPAPVSPQPTSSTMGNTSLPTETISHWPRTELKDMLQSVAHCLHTLNSHGNVPFNPLPLIRSINHALSVI